MRDAAMQVTFVGSVQGHQVERVREFADRLRKARSDVAVTVVEGDAARPLLAQHKLAFGPAVLIDGRIEYVGIPRWRYLMERIAQVGRGVVNPRTAAPPAPPTPPKPAAPAKPSVATPNPTAPLANSHPSTKPTPPA